MEPFWKNFDSNLCQLDLYIRGVEWCRRKVSSWLVGETLGGVIGAD